MTANTSEAELVRPDRLSIDTLTVGYNSEPILLVEDLKVREGEVITLVGPSGAGKTTFFRTISGDLPAVSGEYHIDGKSAGRELRRNFIVRTIQGHPLLHWLTVRGNLELAARIRRVSDIDPDKVLAEFSARHLADRFPSTLSGGERCRASLSQSLLGKPQLMLLDEPFTGLDPIVKQSVADNIFRVARMHRASVIVVSHDLADAIFYSDRVVVLGGSEPVTIVDEVPTSESNALERVRQSLEATK